MLRLYNFDLFFIGFSLFLQLFLKLCQQIVCFYTLILILF